MGGQPIISPCNFFLDFNMENFSHDQQEFIPKTKLIETLNGFLEKPEEDILLSQIEAALRPFWESHPVETPQSVISNPEAMNKLAELIKQHKEKRKD